MEFIGDSDGAAPQLNSVTLSKHEATLLFERLMGNITAWLAREWVHADLSPFNVLYLRGRVIVIDFPQAVDPRSNSNAQEFLLRDVRNICRYFSRYGIKADPLQIGLDLWRRYMRAEP
jgi:RIO kinase 1